MTLPITALFLLWLQATQARYEDFGLRYEVFRDSESHLRDIGAMEFEHALRRLELAIPSLSRTGASSGPGRATSPVSLRRVELFIDESSRELLKSNLPHSGRHYVQAALRYPDGDIHKVKIKYRGDYHWHWSGFKKSLRIKTKKKHLFEEMRSFNLIAPKFEAQLHNELSYRLAARLGLLVPRHEMVNLWINGRNRGLYLLAEQLGESTLRHHRRMPGDIFKGELVGQDEHVGLRNQVFLHPRLWQKIAVNNHYAETSYAPLETLLGTLVPEYGRVGGDLSDQPGAESASSYRVERGKPGAFAEQLDVEAWGRFLAFETLTQSVHYGRSHNWRLYYDPARSVFEPVIWDPSGWARAWLPRGHQKAQADLLPSPLHRQLLSRPEFLLARHRAIEAFLAAGEDERFLAEVDEVIAQVSQVIRFDPDLARDFEILRPAEVMTSMESLRNSIRRVFRDIREIYLEGESSVLFKMADDDPSLIELRIDGRRPPTGFRLEFARPPAAPRRAALGQIVGRQIVGRHRVEDQAVGGQAVQVDISGAVSLHGSAIEVDLPLLSRFAPARTESTRIAKARSLRVEPGEYRLLLPGLTAADRLIELTAFYGPELEQPARRVREWRQPATWPADRLPLPRPAEKTEVWRQEKLIDGLVIVENDLIIQPGTVVRLTEGSTLVVEGRLRAEGHAHRPIQFLPAAPGQEPWGALVIRGRSADGSSFRHVEMGHGSGYKTDLVEYSGMLSIHDVRRVSIRNSRFHESHLVDDMVHAVYAEVEIFRSRFENAWLDAIDFDVVDGVIRESVFIGAGNDNLDLMTSNISVLDSEFHSAKDKGISVGEASQLVAINNLFAANEVGVEVKDGSTAHVLNATFRGNGLALNADSKNWRYGRGGFAQVQFSLFESSHEASEEQKIAAGRRSRIHLQACEIRSESLRESIASAAKIRLSHEPAGVDALPSFALRYVPKVSPGRRAFKRHGDSRDSGSSR